MIAIIISESAIIRSAIARSLLSHFQTVLNFKQIEDIGTALDWADAVTIYDMPYPAVDIPALFRLVPQAALSRTIVLTKQNQDLRAFVTLIGKVGAVMPSSSEADDIALVARVARSGLVLIPSDMLPMLVEQMGGITEAATTAKLTGREANVLALVAEGIGNKAIALKLGISDTTVRVHVRSILKKMRVHNRTEAALSVARNRQPTRSTGQTP